MKKLIVILGSILVIIGLVTAGLMGVAMLTQKYGDVTDKTANINTSYDRPANWRRIVDTPVISQTQMTLVDGSTATIPITAELFRQFYNSSDEALQIQSALCHSTTHYAYEYLISKTSRFDEKWSSTSDKTVHLPTGLILATPPSEEEKAYAVQRGVTLDIAPVAKDGFVFITHKDNPVDSLTVEQVQDIYAGKIKNWKEVGGKNARIKAYQREKNSGSQTAMEQLVMQGIKMKSPITIQRIEGMGELVKSVAEYDNGSASIGYTYYYYINNLYKNDQIKVLKINGVSAENKNLISGAYPFTTSYFAVMRGDEPSDSPARTLRNFLISPQGQEVIETAGYCRAVAENE